MRPHRRGRRRYKRKTNTVDINITVRKLQYANENNVARSSENETSHKIRHKKKQRKHERHSEKHHTTESVPPPRNEGPRRKDHNATLSNNDYALNVTNQIMTFNSSFNGSFNLPFNESLNLQLNNSFNPPFNNTYNPFSPFNNTFNNHTHFGQGIGSQRADPKPSHCYSPNEVLEIIAMTCFVNFVFWFMIISWVNVCTKKQKVRYRSMESLNSVEVAPELELRFQNERRLYTNGVRRPVTASDLVDEGLAEPFLSTNGEDERFCDPLTYANDYKDKGGEWGILHTDEPQVNYWRGRRKNYYPSSQSMQNLLV